MQNTTHDSSTSSLPLPGCEKTYSSTNPLVLFIHLLPAVLVFPMKVALRWVILMYSLSTLLNYWLDESIFARFLMLVTAMAAARIAVQVAAPIVAIAVKWIVIGRYKEGMYPMWGPYHTRWWFVQKVVLIGGIVSLIVYFFTSTYLIEIIGNIPSFQFDSSAILQTFGCNNWQGGYNRARRHFGRA